MSAKEIWMERTLRFFRPRSLRYQLLSRSLLILSVLLVLIGVFQYVFMEQFVYQNKKESIENQLALMPNQGWYQILQNPANPANAGYNLLLAPLTTQDSTVALIDSNGQMYQFFKEAHGETAPRLSAKTYADLLSHPIQDATYQIIQGPHDYELVVLQAVGPQNAPVGVVEVATKVGALEMFVSRQVTIFVILAIGALIIGLLVFLPILQRTLVPLSRMVDTVKRINAGNLDERLPTEKVQLEVEQLSSSFNDMLERLEVSFAAELEAKEKMRRFVADASHELRTPLTSIHGFLEVLLRGAASNPVQLQKALQSMHGESERLNKLVRDLLFLARQDREPDFLLQEGRLDQVVQEMEPQLRMLAGERQVQFSVDHAVLAKFDRDRMKQVILNLFQNAVQHTDSQTGRIEVSLTDNAGGVKLAVQDNGAGVPPEHLAKLFERFYRVDTARSRSAGGAGLGLAITKAIVDTHHGTIRCVSNPGQGARFVVWLPPVL